MHYNINICSAVCMHIGNDRHHEKQNIGEKAMYKPDGLDVYLFIHVLAGYRMEMIKFTLSSFI